MDINQFLTVAGVATICTILVEMLKRLLVWDEAATRRYASAAAIGIGVAGSTFAAFVVDRPTDGSVGQVFLSGVLTGIIGGASASGIYSAGGKQAFNAVLGEHATNTQEAGPQRGA